MEREDGTHTGAILQTETLNSTIDITDEDGATIYDGDNLLVLQCVVTSAQLEALKASPDCFVLRVNEKSREPAKMKSWLAKRGINRAEMQDAKFETHKDIRDIISQHKSRKGR